jgi:hypothetical protein
MDRLGLDDDGRRLVLLPAVVGLLVLVGRQAVEAFLYAPQGCTSHNGN